MDTREILKRLKENDIDVSLKGDDIKITSDSRELPSDLLQEVRKNKESIIAYLKNIVLQSLENTEIPKAEPSLPFYPCTSAQKRLYFLQQFSKESTAYNIPVIHYLGRSVNRQMLETALKQLISRHESLRTYFFQADGVIFQKICENMDFKLDEYTCEIDKFESYVNAYIRPFDLSQSPLVRASVVEIKEAGYVLVIDVHHILSDGISHQVLIDDFFHLYNNHKLPALRIQYKDFSVWQERIAKSEMFEKQKAYWLSVLSGPLPRLNFPIDKPRPPFFTFKGEHIKFVFDEALTTQINSFNRQYKCTLQMTFLAVLNVLFYRYLGQKDFIINCGISGRKYKDLERIVGVFVNSLPIRNTLQGDQTFLSFHNQVAQNCIAAYENQDVQFEELVELLKLERDPSRNPVFDVSLIVQNFEHSTAYKKIDSEENLAAKKLYQSIISYTPKAAKMDMALFVTPREKEIEVNLEYYSAIYDRQTMEKFAEHLTHIFGILMADPSVLLSGIDLLTPGERVLILSEFISGRQKSYSDNTTVHSLFEEQCILTPEKIAVIDETGSYTYREVKEKSDILANFLLYKCVKTESRVGVLQRRSKDLIVSILAIFKAGAAYVPLDSDHPPIRMQYILEDTETEVLVTDKAHLTTGALLQEKVSSIQHLVCIDESDTNTMYSYAQDQINKKYRYGMEHILSAQTEVFKKPKVKINNLAYIMYTSGSTGKPKGVMVEHKGIVRLVKPADYLRLTGEEILLSTMAVSFDFSTFEYWSMLLNGGQLIMCSKDVLLDTKQLSRVIETNKVNIMMFSTGLLNQLVDSDVDLFKRLKTLLVGGEKLSVRHIQILAAQYPEMEILNAYGPTEDTSIALTYRMNGIPEKIPIGKPILNTSAYILDVDLNLCPVGIAGEIYLGGSALARGYLNLPELTAEKFIRNPFCDEEIIYKTGDIGRWLTDGNIEFFGRLDDQIKVRGFRVELGEIEACIEKYGKVDSAVVVADNTGGEYELKAYFVAQEMVSVGDLKNYLKKILPFYMVPAYLVQIPQMPLTMSGKVDRKDLLRLVNNVPPAIEDKVFPTTETQKKLAAIWEQLLMQNRIGIQDNFFDIGGHSLKAMKLISEINKKFEVDISLECLFGNPTIEYIADEIDKIKWTTGSVAFNVDSDHFVI